MIQIDRSSFLNQFPKQLEAVCWVLVGIGLSVALWLPRSPEDRQAMIILFLAGAFCVFAYFHLLLPRVLQWPWILYVPHALMISVLAGFYYITEERAEVEVILALLVAVAAVRTGRKMGFLVALMASLAMTIVPLLKVMPTTPILWTSKAIVFAVYFFIAYLTSSVAGNYLAQVERVSVLNDVARALGSTIEMESLLQLVHQQLSRVIPSDTYFVGVHEPCKDFIDLKMIFDGGEYFPPQRVPFGEGLGSLVIQRREPLLVRALSVERARLQTKPLVIGHARLSESWLGVPMLMRDEFVGAIAVAAYKANAFGTPDIALLDNIGAQVALALDNARHHLQVEDQARRDSLTGAFNHGYLWAELTKQVESARAQGSTVSLIMLDIDHFKSYNDTYGHVKGDEVLRLIVQAIQAHIKQTDTVARWGGEEFAIILNNTAMDKAFRVAERIRETLLTLPLLDDAGKSISQPTVSQGIAVFPNHAHQANSLVDAADRTLYLAKRQGRDQIRIASTFRN